jgi:hypothetical protein
MKRLTDYKSKYYTAMSKVNKTLLPEYEMTLFNWFNNVQEEQSEPLMIGENKKKKKDPE